MLQRTLATLLMIPLLVGCNPPTTPRAKCATCSPVVYGPPPAPTDAPYRIGAGDELAIQFFFSPEMNTTTQVRPDGKIALAFIGEVTAAGTTPEALGAQIRKQLRRYMKQPDLVVTVRNAASNRVYVGGEVAKAGPVQMLGRETLMQVLNAAGWVLPTADRNEIVLVRTDAQGTQAVHALDLDRITSGRDMAHNVPLQAGDIILVPPSDITSFDRWIDQHIRLATPLPGSFVITNQYKSGSF